ncbi:DUF935 domain-containing protein [Pseudacidovorax intermedius]|uniref:DUF935 domain-containing protein n=1 Tax=Pseudacidovorax intermedius TaxID=433924 RepID=UPI0026E9E9FB|nr:DUF935 domain-containing protein [Pseudacidovorax intermedius]
MAQILDQFGNPIERQALAEPQSARLAALRQEWEGHPSSGLTPPRLAMILKEAEQGDLTRQHELFADMEEKNGHLFSEMQKRRLAPQTLEWSIEPPEDATAEEKNDAAWLKEVVPELGDFEDLLFDASDAVGHGFSALELQWSLIEGQRLITSATHRPQGWFKTSSMPGADRNELRLRSDSAEGEELWSFGWLVHRHRARSGYLARTGLYRVLAWPNIFLMYAERDLAEFLEIYGLPLRLGTYGPNATAQDKATLLRAVVDIGHNAAAIIPQGMLIDFKQAAQGDNKAFDAMISLMERIISKAILGGTLTSGEGEHGTQALGNVHNEVRHDLMKSDVRQYASTIRAQLFYPLLAVNKGRTSLRRCPRLVFDTQEPEDVAAYSEALPGLVSLGMRIRRSWAHTKLKIPEAGENDQDVLQLAQPETLRQAEADGRRAAADAGRQALALNRAKLPGAASAAGDQADALDGLADEMMGEWIDAVGDELRQPLQDALDQANSYEDFQAALETGLASIPAEKFVDLLSRGQFAARMWGRLNRETGAK